MRKPAPIRSHTANSAQPGTDNATQGPLNALEKGSDKTSQIARLREEHQSLSRNKDYIQVRNVETMF